MTPNMSAGFNGFLSDNDWPWPANIFPSLLTDPKRPSTPTTATSPDAPLEGWPGRAELSDELLQRVYDSICADAGCAPTALLENIPTIKCPATSLQLNPTEDDSRSTTGGLRSPKSEQGPCTEEKMLLRLAATSGNWSAAFESTCAILACESAQNASTTHQSLTDGGVLEQIKPTDLVYLCASLLAPWPRVCIASDCCDFVNSRISDEAQSLRGIASVLQTLLVAGKRRGALRERNSINKKLLLAAMTDTARQNKATIEAFAPLFFSYRDEQETTATFRAKIERWAPCGFLQHIFELFVLALARAKRWKALAMLLSCSRVGEALMKPIVNSDLSWQILPELEELNGVRQEILVDLRFPVLAVVAMLEDLCMKSDDAKAAAADTTTTTTTATQNNNTEDAVSQHSRASPCLCGNGFDCSCLMNGYVETEDWVRKNAIPLFHSTMTLVCSRAYSDEVMCHRTWHYEAINSIPASSLAPGDLLARLCPVLRDVGIDDETPQAVQFSDYLDRVVTTFVFAADPIFAADYRNLIAFDVETGLVKREFSACQRGQVLQLWSRVHESVMASERFYSLLELWSRISETFLLADKRSPAVELLELGDNTTRESVLELSRRTVHELTGCDLTHIEIYLMRIIEAYEAQCGIPSDLPGLQGPRKTFVTTLNLSNFVYECFLETIVQAKIPPSAFCCTTLRCSPNSSPNSKGTTTTTTKLSFGEESSAGTLNATAGGARHTKEDGGLVFPTLLPLHVAQYLPAWFATRGTIMSTFGLSSRQYIGWRALYLELLAVSIMVENNATSRGLMVAPHLQGESLKSFVLLYTDCANPRALHLLTRFTTDCLLDKEFLIRLLHKAKVSKFVLMADAISQLFVFDDSSTAVELSNLLLEVYISAGRGHDAHLFLKSLNETECAALMRRKWGQEIDRMIGNNQSCDSTNPSGDESFGNTGDETADILPLESSLFPSSEEISTLSLGANNSMGISADLSHTAQHTRTMRWRKAAQILKSMSANGGVDSARGAVTLFHDLRKSPGGIPDISVGNKVIHICITHGKLSEAEKLYNLLRADAHHGSSNVKPDVVTCNILLKRLAKRKPPQIDEMERLIRQMERPFEMGGDGITADQVTFNTMINAAVTAGSFTKAWDYLTEMRSRGIKVDGFTCSILMKQITPSTKPELIQEILQLLDDLDPIEDPVLLSSIVDVYSRLRDLDRLTATLDRYQQKVLNPTPYALATLVKGYGRCGLMSPATALWQRLERMQDVQWSPYIFGCAVDCFVTNGDLDKALSILAKATAEKVVIFDLQYSVLIRACTQRRRLHDALRLYKEMKANNLQPCDVTYNNLMHLCVVAGDLETAVEILNDMTHNARHRPDVVTYSTIIKGLCDRGAMKLAMQLFEDIPRRGVEPDVVAYNTLLEGFAKADDVEQVEALYARQLERNVKPTCYTLTILIKFYGRRHQLDRVLHLVETLPRLYAIRMDAFVYTATIAACTWNGRVDKAIGFLETMRTSFGASARTYGTLVAGCVRQQSWQPLSVVLRYAAEDGVILGKRDASSLHELLQEWMNKNIAHKWLRTGFDSTAAAHLKHFLAGQRAGVGSVRRGRD